MSRTRHHRTQKFAHCGDDYWSPRGGQHGNMYNSYTKARTHRVERLEGKSLCRHEIGVQYNHDAKE